MTFKRTLLSLLGVKPSSVVVPIEVSQAEKAEAPESIDKSRFLSLEAEKQLSSPDYWKRVDDYAIDLTYQAKDEFSENGLSVIDTFLTAAAGIAVDSNVDMVTFLTRAISNWQGVGGVVPEAGNFLKNDSFNQKPPKNKNQLN